MGVMKEIPREDMDKWSRKGWEYDHQTPAGLYMIHELEPWQKLEIRAKYFLQDMGFEQVDGGSRCKIGHPEEVQVDACGGCDSYFLVLECKSSKDPNSNTLREYLNEFAGKKVLLQDGIRQKHAGKYSSIIQVMVLEGIDWKTDKKLADGLGIRIWDVSYFDEYLKIKDLFMGTARYQVMADLGVYIQSQERLKVSAIRFKLRDYVCYGFAMKPDDLIKIAYVFRRGVSSSMAYQRSLRSDRMNSISRFLSEGGYFSNSIIVAFTKSPEFRTLDEFYGNDKVSSTEAELGQLILPQEYCCAQIVDGQHRVYGSSTRKRTTDDLLFSVTAFDRITADEQANLFLTINREQKPVEPNLLWDLLGQLRPHTIEGAISRIVKKLDDDSRSPLKDMIYIPVKGRKKKKNQPTMVNLCEEIKRTKLVSQDLKERCNLWTGQADTTVERATKVLSLHFKTVARLFKADWDKSENGFTASGNGIVIMMRILQQILILGGGKTTEADVEAALKPLAVWFKRQSLKKQAELRRTCSSGAGRSEVTLKMVRVINKQINRFGQDLLSEQKTRLP